MLIAGLLSFLAGVIKDIHAAAVVYLLQIFVGQGILNFLLTRDRSQFILTINGAGDILSC